MTTESRLQRDKALRALRRMGLAASEIAELCGMERDYVIRICQGIEPQKLACCQRAQPTTVIGRQMGHHAETNVRMPQ